jgi:Virulence-associated protein E/Bifunctional DNA primase/polymerase, N-terminal/Primase C terminal 1 (PriCT-1)
MQRPLLPALTDPVLVWAQWYAALDWPIFPCKGKAPLTRNGFHDASTDPLQLEAWWQHWPTANIGMPVGAHQWVLDCDPRHQGDDTLRDLEASHGELPRTLQCNTGGGGLHLYWQLPLLAMRKRKITLGPGLDVQKDGQYVILPPSIHPDTGKPYVWECDFGPDDAIPQPTPPWLAALLTSLEDEPTPDAPPLDADAPIPEGMREATLMRMLGAMQRQGASQHALRAFLDTENQRCVPPLDEGALERMCASVARYSPIPVLEVSPATPVGWSSYSNGTANGTQSHFGPDPLAWRRDLFCKKNGELTQNAFNIGQILRFHPYWKEPERHLWYDVIRGYAMCGSYQITKQLATQITQWFGGQERLPISNIDLLKTCLEAECSEHLIDVLKAEIDNLPAWDEEPRLESWLSDITDAPDCPYTRDISRRVPVSMIARALFPGCQCREVVILEGHENVGKSRLVKALAGDAWYTPLSMSLEGKDSHIMLHKYWVAELAELDALTRTEEARMKAFVTMQADNYVPKYSNVSVSIPRRTIFVGTTNEKGGYLKGQSGNTRYMPLWIGKRVDVDAFMRDREQIFAEAKEHYQTRLAHWWDMADDTVDSAIEERERRRESNYYEDALHEWLTVGRFAQAIYDGASVVQFQPHETSWPEIARWFLKLDTPERWKDRGLQIQIANALKSLGWHPANVWKWGRSARIWSCEGGDT